VSLRILFADDSMTAQNMGKKILSEAGYDVVAVSNGAAAVKKIAEQKPDIIILDVYMPGYSGLEVCEKVRGSLDTVKTPVLLTVGKMEPYKPEDANRVKADGVIIKPFEASDLLAIMKKFEERIGNAPPPPMVQQTELMERQYAEDENAARAEILSASSPTGRTGSQPMVEVPDHMAGSAAFGDLLGSEPANATAHFAVNTPATAFETSVIVPAPPMPVGDYEVPVAETEEEPAPPVVAAPAPMQASAEEVAAPADTGPELIATPVEDVPAPTAPILVESAPEPATMSAEPAPPHPQFIPVYKEPELTATGYEVIPTAAPSTGDLDIPREPALEETAEETTRSTVADRVEPGLMPTIATDAFPTPAAQGSAPTVSQEISSSDSLARIDATSEVTDADFEARVAAAMAAYNHAEAPQTVEPEAKVTKNEHVDAYGARAVEMPPVAAPVPSFEYQPPVRAAEAALASSASAAAGAGIEHVSPAPAGHSTNVEQAAVEASVETALPEAATVVAADAAADHHNIAQAVHRVMERLKPELVEEIMRELRSKK
jgi:CheY-like chemotaxis protein